MESETEQMLSSFLDVNAMDTSVPAEDLNSLYGFGENILFSASSPELDSNVSTPPTSGSSPRDEFNLPSSDDYSFLANTGLSPSFSRLPSPPLSNGSSNSPTAMGNNGECIPSEAFSLSTDQTSTLLPFSFSPQTVDLSNPIPSFNFTGPSVSIPAGFTNPFDPTALFNFPPNPLHFFNSALSVPPATLSTLVPTTSTPTSGSDDLSKILKSSTAVACQQLLNEPAKRKPGRKKKSETAANPESAKASAVQLSAAPAIKLENPFSQPPLAGLQPSSNTPKLPLYPIGHTPQPEPNTPKNAPAATPTTGMSAAMAKRQERLIKNREAADQSRKRKREHLQQLEAHAAQLISENDLLKKKVLELEMKVGLLTDENGQLRGKLGLGFVLEDTNVGVGSVVSYNDSGLNGNGKRVKSDVLFEEKNSNKAVNAVFMVFLFSFALLFFPTQRSSILEPRRPIVGISASAHDDSSRVFDLIGPSNHGSFSPNFVNEPAVIAPKAAKPTVVPSFDWTSMPRSFLNVPISNLTDFLSVLSMEHTFSKESRDELTRLQSLFEYTMTPVQDLKKDDVIIKQEDGEMPTEVSPAVVKSVSTPITKSKDSEIPCLPISPLQRVVPYTHEKSLPATSNQCTCKPAESVTHRFSLLTHLENRSAMESVTDMGFSNTNIPPMMSQNNKAMLRIDFEIVGASLVRIVDEEGTESSVVVEEEEEEKKRVTVKTEREQKRKRLREERSKARKDKRWKGKKAEVEEVGN